MYEQLSRERRRSRDEWLLNPEKGNIEASWGRRELRKASLKTMHPNSRLPFPSHTSFFFKYGCSVSVTNIYLTDMNSQSFIKSKLLRSYKIVKLLLLSTALYQAWRLFQKYCKYCLGDLRLWVSKDKMPQGTQADNARQRNTDCRWWFSVLPIDWPTTRDPATDFCIIGPGCQPEASFCSLVVGRNHKY